MLEVFTQFYEKGDTQSLVGKLLHTCYWQQHDFRAYGHAQIREVMTNWLALAGRCAVEVIHHYRAPHNDVAVLQLTPGKSQTSFSLCLDIHHNDVFVKTVNCIVDTQRLCISKGKSSEYLCLTLPQPDPLLLSDYDHQYHLKNDHAIPSMLMSEPVKLSEHLDAWWQIWSQGQFSQIDKSYAEKAKLQVPGNHCYLSRLAFFDWLTQFRSQFKRTFCQLTKVLFTDDAAIMQWYFEGDPRDSESRERIVFASFLQFQAGNIVEEILISDCISYSKRYPNSQDIFFLTKKTTS